VQGAFAVNTMSVRLMSASAGTQIVRSSLQAAG
jgi:hypothetical protein